MAEKIADNFEKTMKKGFVNIFVLMVLHKEPTHGYQLKKLIEERTFGFWSPSDSTMYTILNRLRDKGLIQLSDIQDPEDTRKVYKLTKKGVKTLKLMKEREREMRESMKALILSTTDIDDDFFDDSLLDIILKGPKVKKSPFHGHSINRSFIGPLRATLLSDLNERPKEEQIKLLKRSRNFIGKQIQNLTQILENIDKLISDIQSE